MNSFESKLRRRVEDLEKGNLFRRLRSVSSPQQTRICMEGRELTNFSSNDYLGLATHQALTKAAIKATERWGNGSGSSRLISGSLAPHRELEEGLAAFKGTERALVFSSGYSAALGTITALVDKDDVVILDKLVHASIIDASRLSGATLRVFHHNDFEDLESILKWADRSASGRNVLIVTESLFSMDGDIAPLNEIVGLKEKYGAWLMVDEAHATGVFGANRRGLAEQYGCSDGIEVQMGTLGKALGSAGGYIAGSGTLIELLVNKARSFIFSTAPPPASSAAARAALAIVDSDEGAILRDKLQLNIAEFRRFVSSESAPTSPIVPFVVGPEDRAMTLANVLTDRGIFVPAIRFPSVRRGQARLRFTITSSHEFSDFPRVAEALGAPV